MCLALLIGALLFIVHVNSYLLIPKLKGFNHKIYLQESAQYYPQMGIESFIVTLGNLRPLMSSEYELVFSRFPVLGKLSAIKKWPQRDLNDREITRINEALAMVKGIKSDDDVEMELSKFRKTILGLEKYEDSTTILYLFSQQNPIGSHLTTLACFFYSSSTTTYHPLK
jgi:hypothetical protein